MTKEQLQVLKELTQDTTFKGQKQLQYLIWLNTSKSKYKVGDFCEVTNPSQSIYGIKVYQFKAKIIKVYSYATQDFYMYETECYIIKGDKETKIKVCVSEDNTGAKCEDNRNILK